MFGQKDRKTIEEFLNRGLNLYTSTESGYGNVPQKSVNNMETEHELVQVDVMDDDSQRVIINIVGHDPKDISIETSADRIEVMSADIDSPNKFVSDIDLELIVHGDCDGSKAVASVEHGLLTIIVPTSKEKKKKSIKINY